LSTLEYPLGTPSSRSARTCVVLLIALSGPSRQPHPRRSHRRMRDSPPRWGALAAARAAASTAAPRKPACARRVQIGLTGRPHPLARAAALDPYQWFGAVGNHTTLPVALAAGFGGAVALLLVVGIVMILRNRRSARATDPVPGVRTPFVVE
jgi:hypothetical protein